MGLMDGTTERLNKAREYIRGATNSLNGANYLASNAGAALLVTLTECLCIELAALREQVGEVKHAATDVSTSIDETREALMASKG